MKIVGLNFSTWSGGTSWFYWYGTRRVIKKRFYYKGYRWTPLIIISINKFLPEDAD